VACLRCGARTEGSAIICDPCADETFQSGRSFLPATLWGTGLLERVRDQAVAMLRLGPVVSSAIERYPAAPLLERFRNVDVRKLPPDNLRRFLRECNTALRHLGVPTSLDSPSLPLSRDAAELVATILQKINVAEAMAPGEGEPELYLRLGLVYWLAGHGPIYRATRPEWATARRTHVWDRGKEFFGRVKPDDELYPLALRGLGQLSLDGGDFVAAEEHLAAAARSFPNDQVILEGLGTAHFHLENSIDALRYFDEALAIRETPAIWVHKARLLEALHKFEEALSCYTQALALDPRHLPALQGMGAILRALGRAEELAEIETRILEIVRPAEVEALRQLLREAARPAPPPPPPAPPPAPPTAPPVAPPPRPTPPAQAPPAGQLEPVPAPAGPPPVPAEAAAVPPLPPVSPPAPAPARPAAKPAGLPQVPPARAAPPAPPAVAPAPARAPAPPAPRPAAPPAVPNWLGEARGLLSRGEPPAAIDLLERQLSAEPANYEGTLLLGQAYFQQGDHERAMERTLHAIKLNRNAPEGWYWRARISEGLGKWGAALQFLDHALKLRKDFDEAWILRGELTLRNNKEEEADRSFEMATELAPQNPAGWLGRAKTSLKLGRWGAAIQCVDRFLALKPDDREGWRLRGEILLGRGKFDLAAKSYKKYLDLVPDDPNAWCQRGIALHSLGLADEARECFRRSLELDATNRQARTWLSSLEQARTGE